MSSILGMRVIASSNCLLSFKSEFSEVPQGAYGIMGAIPSGFGFGCQKAAKVL